MTNREMVEKINETAPHIDAILYALNELEAAANRARSAFYLVGDQRFLSDANKCEKIANELSSIYFDIIAREASEVKNMNTQESDGE